MQATEVSLDNLQDAELQALLDEVVQYRGPRDGEKGTELFQVTHYYNFMRSISSQELFIQALLKETQESGEESPPAFRATSTNSSTVQRRRRSRKESNRSFPHPSITPPTHPTTIAGSNRKGGSLQNISSHHR